MIKTVHVIGLLAVPHESGEHSAIERCSVTNGYFTVIWLHSVPVLGDLYPHEKDAFVALMTPFRK